MFRGSGIDRESLSVNEIGQRSMSQTFCGDCHWMTDNEQRTCVD
jgi:hypothetical protein